MYFYLCGRLVRKLHICYSTKKNIIMKLIKTTLIALTLTIGFFSNAQETNTRRNSELEKAGSMSEVKLANSTDTPEQIAQKRAEEIRLKEQLNEQQFVQVKSLFLKIENRKGALNNVSEAERANALVELKTIENRELDLIIHPVKKQVDSPKTKEKTATNM